MGTSVATAEKTAAKLNLEVLQSQLSPKQRHMITPETVEELQNFADDPDYGEEFLDCYRDHLNVLGSNSKYTSVGYMSAVKFFVLLEAGNNITDSYIKVFPERYARRVNRGGEKSDISGEASRYNGTAIVNEIRKIAAIPVQLIYRHLLHEAIVDQADLMRTAKSDFVRQKAGEILIKELKPAEDNVLTIDLEDGARSAISALHDAAEKLAVAERQTIQAGGNIKDVIEGKLMRDDVEIVIEEPEEIPEPEIEEEFDNTPPCKAGDWKF